MTNRITLPILIFVLAAIVGGCKTPTEPGTTPPQPHFVINSQPPNPVDHGIYADPVGNRIDLDWYRDSSKTTTGYLIFRAVDGALGSDNLLKNRMQVANITSSNQLFETLDTSWVDTTGTIAIDSVYYYQVQAYNTSGSNVKTLSAPSEVGYFTLLAKPTVNSPSTDQVNAQFLSFGWNDPENASQYQIIVRSGDAKKVYWSSETILLSSPLSEPYPSDTSVATPLTSGAYQWRVRSLGTHQGGSSNWQNFGVK